MKKEDIKNQADYGKFWHQEREKYDDGEITWKELDDILGEAVKITREQLRRTWLESNKDILCNNCSGTLMYFWEGSHVTGLAACEVHGGYCTPGILWDMTKYKFNLCEKCLKEMFDKFEIPVETEETNFSLTDMLKNIK